MSQAKGSAALPAALGALAVSLVLAAAVAETARVETRLARSRRDAALALATADACLTRAVMDLSPGWDFAWSIAGSDGVLGTRDDGILPVAPPCTGATIRPAPGPPAPPRALVVVEGRTDRGRRLVEGIVGLGPLPGVGALVWLEQLPPAGAITGTVMLDGVDPGEPTLPPPAGVAAPVEPAALDTWVAGEGDRLQVGTGTAPPRRAASPPAALLVARADAMGAAGADALSATGPPSGVTALARGDLVIPGALYGTGLLVVDGALDIRGSLHFTGVVVARRGVRIAAGGSLQVDGSLWIGTPGTPDPALRVDGLLDVRHAAAALAAADALLPLPREAILLGLRDVG